MKELKGQLFTEDALMFPTFLRSQSTNWFILLQVHLLGALSLAKFYMCVFVSKRYNYMHFASQIIFVLHHW